MSKKISMILCIVLIMLVAGFIVMKNNEHVTSDDAVFNEENGIITSVQINGRFPYSKITLNEEKNIRENSDGKETCKVIYNINSEFSLFLAVNPIIDIEVSDLITYIYILQFKDKEVQIENGKIIN